MPRKIRNFWPDRRRDAFLLAERLVAETGNGLPTNLGKIAAKQRVRKIEFKPLLTDGALAVDTDGFVIYVNCGPGDAIDFTERFADDGTGSSLPRTIARRARFTVAHEIAHTLFFNLEASPPKEKIRLEHSASVRSLELTCNEIAGVFTMPELLIEREFREAELLWPEELRELADRTLMSSQALVRRFQNLRRLTHPEAIIVNAMHSDTGWSITAISRHYALRDIFPEAKPGASVRALVNDPDFLLFGGERSEVAQPFVGHRGTSVLRVNCEARCTSRRLSDVLITARPIHVD